MEEYCTFFSRDSCKFCFVENFQWKSNCFSSLWQDCVPGWSLYTLEAEQQTTNERGNNKWQYRFRDSTAAAPQSVRAGYILALLVLADCRSILLDLFACLKQKWERKKVELRTNRRIHTTTIQNTHPRAQLVWSMEPEQSLYRHNDDDIIWFTANWSDSPGPDQATTKPNEPTKQQKPAKLLARSLVVDATRNKTNFLFLSMNFQSKAKQTTVNGEKLCQHRSVWLSFQPGERRRRRRIQFSNHSIIKLFICVFKRHENNWP